MKTMIELITMPVTECTTEVTGNTVSSNASSP